jgi:hypothetical protein
MNKSFSSLTQLIFTCGLGVLMLCGAATIAGAEWSSSGGNTTTTDKVASGGSTAGR